MPSTFRRDWITKPIFRLAQHALPRLSTTEREAIEAGDVWWDAALFSGNPDWRKLLETPPAKLTDEERAEYQAYVAAIDVISILQAQAGSVLARQPNA